MNINTLYNIHCTLTAIAEAVGHRPVHDALTQWHQCISNTHLWPANIEVKVIKWSIIMIVAVI